MRFFNRRTLGALAIAAGCTLSSQAYAEAPPTVDPQVKLLIERLEAAEKQIQSLSSELNKVKTEQQRARPFPSNRTAPNTLPVAESMLPLEVDGVFRNDDRVITLENAPEPVSVPEMAEKSFSPTELVVFDGEDESDPDGLAVRLGLLEEGWAKFNESEKKKKSDAAKKPTFQINGRIHADYWNYVHNSEGIGFFAHPDMMEDNFGDPPEDRALFRRIRLEMKGDILETMLWRVQIDFNNPSSAEIKDVYLGFKELPGNHTFLIGHQKRPIGLDHLNSSRYNVFVERPFVVETFNEDARRLGACFHGHTDDESLIWSYGAFFLENISRDGRYIGQSNQMSVNGRLAGSPWYDEVSDGRGYFHWGLSGMFARTDGDTNDSDTNSNEARFRTRVGARTDERWLNTQRIDGAESYEVIGLESIFNVGPFQAVSEFQNSWVQREGGDDLHFQGAYVYLSYFLTGEHIPYNRKTGTIGRVKPFENFFLVDNCCGGVSTGWGAWNIAVRYDYLDLSDSNVLGGVGEAWTTALNWHWTPYSKVQIDASYGDIREHAAVGGFTGGNYFLIGTRFAIEF